jgi:hypothetical protein
MSSLEIVFIDLVVTNRVLARIGAVDVYGHVSQRHPTGPQRGLGPDSSTVTTYDLKTKQWVWSKPGRRADEQATVRSLRVGVCRAPAR